ncbi:hypothetical protein H310_12279 [Aphanomyces invadans]|uniref:Uncharacterized protein n=1 Tax=Aphanomyces invadans TaxID=157072 RepID=A0A024TIT4_9STRA|nr:hypothetical protein H310_12279 [Aphanomyces invadans]ETV93943.1 hypothetical protein H310_12279 [Aphanomyces invadans]|eukprot:XP_008877503.1 hypothetical protein H310_12279 [Aphanomyces invadans]
MGLAVASDHAAHLQRHHSAPHPLEWRHRRMDRSRRCIRCYGRLAPIAPKHSSIHRCRDVVRSHGRRSRVLSSAMVGQPPHQQQRSAPYIRLDVHVLLKAVTQVYGPCTLLPNGRHDPH